MAQSDQIVVTHEEPKSEQISKHFDLDFWGGEYSFKSSEKYYLNYKVEYISKNSDEVKIKSYFSRYMCDQFTFNLLVSNPDLDKKQNWYKKLVSLSHKEEKILENGIIKTAGLGTKEPIDMGKEFFENNSYNYTKSSFITPEKPKVLHHQKSNKNKQFLKIIVLLTKNKEQS